MTLLNRAGSVRDVVGRFGGTDPGRSQAHSTAEGINVGSGERAVSVASGSIVAAMGLYRGDLAGLVMAAIGGGLIYRGASGQCSLYKALNINTAQETDASGRALSMTSSRRQKLTERGLHVTQSFLINRSPEDLYSYWRNFENLPRIMSYLESVRVIDEKRSHWVAKAPKLAGGKVEWDAEITIDEPNARIGWRSLSGADVDNQGQVQFTPGTRGTAVRVVMDYMPPAGRVGKWISTLFGENPETVVREDLRNFKRVMELGEVPTTEGQSRGTCTGKGMRS